MSACPACRAFPGDDGRAPESRTFPASHSHLHRRAWRDIVARCTTPRVVGRRSARERGIESIDRLPACVVRRDEFLNHLDSTKAGVEENGEVGARFNRAARASLNESATSARNPDDDRRARPKSLDFGVTPRKRRVPRRVEAVGVG